MKPLLIGVISVVVFAANYSQTVQSDCNAPDSVAFYTEDAAWLALQQTIRMDSSYLDTVVISKSLQDTFLRAINALYNAVLPAKDTFEIIDYRLFRYRVSLNKIEIFEDTAVLWFNRLMYGLTPTNHPRVGSLMEEYGLTVDEVYRYSSRWRWAMVTLKARDFNNIYLLKKRFESFLFTSVSYAHGVGDGSSITGETKDGLVILTYSRGWQDCPSGCISRRFWQFTVFPDCSVRFDSSFGDILPPEEFAVNPMPEMQGLYVVPNPASDELKVFNDEDGIIEIVDLNGRAILRQEVRAPQQEISIESLPMGMYVIRLTSKSGMLLSTRFIKQ